MPDSLSPAATRDYRGWQLRILAATWLAYAGYYFCRKPFYVLKAPMADSLGWSPLALGQLGMAYNLAYVVGQFTSAFFGRRLGPRLLLLVGMAISIACNLAFGVANGFWTLLLFLALNGIAQGTGWPGCIGSLAYWFKRRQRGSVLGVWSTCYQLGSVLAGSYAAYLLGLAGWRWSFFGASMILLAVWFAVLWLHPNRPEDVGLEPLHDEDEEGQARASPVLPQGPDAPGPGTTGPNPGQPCSIHAADPDRGAVSRSARVVPSHRPARGGGLGWSRPVVATILLMGLIYFCLKFLRYALWSWSPYFLNKNFGLSGSDAGYLSVVFDGTGFVGVLVAGFLSDRLFKGRRAFLSFALLLLTTGAFVIMYRYGAASVLVFAISLGLVGFALYGPDSLLSGAGAIDVGSPQGALSAAGIINGMGSLGQVCQEPLIPWLYESYGREIAPILLLLVGVAVAGCAATFLLWRLAARGFAKI